ncbi:MAG: hypothetical protein IJW55_06400 [Clostridia bacterium]|nr:hypothetical protein [Clostridia bacterium]
MKKRIVWMLTAALLLCSMLLSACTTDQPSGEESGSTVEETTTAPAADAKYSVTVSDYFGKGLKDVIVKVLRGEELVTMKATGDEGKVSLKLEDGDYNVELDFPSETVKASYTYDATDLKLTADAPALTVTLYNVYSETANVQGYSHVRNATVPTTAYKVSEGAYDLKELNTADRTYFLFRPTRAGLYQFRVVSDARFEFGYYGGNTNGSKETILPVENKTVEVEIRSLYIGDSEETTTPYLIGVMPKSESVTNCILVIERVGDLPFSPLDAEWKTILPTENDLKRINYLNWTFSDFTAVDITADEVTVIYNETDGLYHYGTANGPVIYIRINSACGYLGEDGTIYGAAEMSQFGAHFYDDAGNFLYKETYNQLIFDYSEICDTVNGACPLTKQLVYVMEVMGAWKGWFDSTSGNYLFSGVAVNRDMMPYFACGYYQTVTQNTSGTEGNPIKVNGDTNGAVMLEKGTALSFTSTATVDITFEIADKNGDLQVNYNGKTYVASNGKITFTVKTSQKNFTLSIRSASSAETLAAVITEIT